MKKATYMAPAIEIVSIQAQPIMGIIGVSGEGMGTGGNDPNPSGTGGDSRRHSFWDDDED